MTRLKEQDIDQISDRLAVHNEQMIKITGCGLFELACYCYGVQVESARALTDSYTVGVIPVTAGQGVISSFTDTVAAIVRYLGFQAFVSRPSDVAGLAFAIENGADAILMADDEKFIGLHCESRTIVDNGETTGRVYATALTLMAGGFSGKTALVLGCGPVGYAAAEQLLRFGGHVTLLDTDVHKAYNTQERLVNSTRMQSRKTVKVIVGENPEKEILRHDLILDATPSALVVPDELLTSRKLIALPGVPPGISEYGFETLHGQVVHDKLELGVAGMVIALLLPTLRLGNG